MAAPQLKLTWPRPPAAVRVPGALGGVASIQITAVSSDGGKAVVLADTTADELSKYLVAANDLRYDAQQKDLIEAKDAAKAKQDSARQELADIDESTRGTRILCDYLTMRGFLT